MKKKGWLSSLEKVIQWVDRLPSAVREPITRELRPIREIFLQSRPARIACIGKEGLSPREFFETVSGRSLQAGAMMDGWTQCVAEGGFSLEWADARAGDTRLWKTPRLPDVVVIFSPSEDMLSHEKYRGQIEEWASLEGKPSVVLVEGPGSAGLREIREAYAVFSESTWRVVKEEDSKEIAEALCASVPAEARLELARFFDVKSIQRDLARAVLPSFSAICGVIALQPIPFADMPVLTTIQTLMVGLIIYASGRSWNMRLASESLAALGVNLGAGFVFREIARNLIKGIPVAGNVVSGTIAGSGTYAIGRAAIAYFIEGNGVQKSRRFLKKRS